MAITTGVRPATPRPTAKRPRVNRRSFLRATWIGGILAALAGFGTGSIYFLWPNLTSGFGTKIKAGTKSQVDAGIKQNNGYFYVPEGRFYLVPYAGNGANTIYKAVNAASGYLALYQRCVHLGCRVPWCPSSQWWECPCHGSKYNHAGEYKEGPAPRGLDRFAIIVQGDTLVVDTSKIITGPPRGTNTTGQELQGPHCVGGSAGA